MTKSQLPEFTPDYVLSNEQWASIFDTIQKNAMDIKNRRYATYLNEPSELAIQNAIWEVENIGADERLTQAVELLMEAKNLVADYIDETIHTK